MKQIESLRIKEKAYYEKLENGLTIILIPKMDTNKKYVIWGTHFGSIDNEFVIPESGEKIRIPDGVAHFLEHKMFEQPNGTNSLDTLMALGIDANAYTTNDHTAYLFECTDHFYEGLDELMDYVQHPYFTDENVEKEKGIIEQEIKMYEDDPGWQMYMNAMKCLYKNNPINIDIAGSKESIYSITKETLYQCYNTFYHPSNMILVACGNFEPKELIEEIKKRLVSKTTQGEIERIYSNEEEKINEAYKEVTMEVSTPIFAIGFKDKIVPEGERVKRHIAIEILLDIIMGKSSKLYKELYEQGILLAPLDTAYEFSNQYAHILISGQAKEPKKVEEAIKQAIKDHVQNGLDEKVFTRIKKKIYGDYVVEYNNVADIARMFLADTIKGIQSFDYIEEYSSVTKEYAEQLLKEIFNEKNQVMSVVKGK